MLEEATRSVDRAGGGHCVSVNLKLFVNSTRSRTWELTMQIGQGCNVVASQGRESPAWGHDRRQSLLPLRPGRTYRIPMRIDWILMELRPAVVVRDRTPCGISAHQTNIKSLWSFAGWTATISTTFSSSSLTNASLPRFNHLGSMT